MVLTIASNVPDQWRKRRCLRGWRIAPFGRALGGRRSAGRRARIARRCSSAWPSRPCRQCGWAHAWPEPGTQPPRIMQSLSSSCLLRYDRLTAALVNCIIYFFGEIKKVQGAWWRDTLNEVTGHTDNRLPIFPLFV